MNCHECARIGVERLAIGLCRSCSVGLCKDHLVASFQGPVFPRYGCDHEPSRAFARRARTEGADRASTRPREAVKP